MDHAQLEAFSDRTAQKVAERIVDLLGADMATPEGRKAIRDNWSWLTDTRTGTQFIRKTSWATAIVAIVGAIISGLWWAITKGLAAVVKASG